MENEIDWEYWPDQDTFINTGDIYLYRNPIELDGAGGKSRKYVITPQPPESHEIQLKTTKPVASGITAYFASDFGNTMSLYNCISRVIDFDTESIYEVYLKYVSKLAITQNKKSPKPKPEAEVDFLFLSNHLEQERKYLLDSSDYYDEFHDHMDAAVKSQIKIYVNSYIEWIESKRKDLLEKHPGFKNLLANNKYFLEKSIPISILPFIKLDDAQFIKATESFLKFINFHIDLQFYPDSAFLKNNFISFECRKGTIFSYFLKIDSDILNYEIFENRITNMLLKGVPKENLKSLISETYSLATNISKLPDEKIILSPNKKHYIQFNHVVPEWGYINKESIDSDVQNYSNFDLVRYSIFIKKILEDKLGMKDFTIANNTISHQINQQEHLEISVSKAKLYLIKIEAFLESVKYAFELQLNPDMDYILAERLGIYAFRNTCFEFIFSPLANFLDFEIFKKHFAIYINDFESLEVPKAFLKQIFRTTSEIDILYSNRIENTTWDKTVTLYVKNIKESISMEPGTPFYPEDFICYSNREIAVNALKMHKYLKSKLFPVESKDINLPENTPSLSESPPTSSLLNVEFNQNTSEQTNSKKEIDDILNPLTIEQFTIGKNKKIIYCIDNSFKNYLKDCFLALLEESEIPVNKNEFKIQSNVPFYNAILSLINKFNFKTESVIRIILNSRNIDCDNLKFAPARSVRNEITAARKRREKE